MNITINKNLASITKALVLFAAYSFLVFFYFHYRSHTSEGYSIFFDFKFSSFVFYFFVCLIVSLWMYRSQSFNKQFRKLSITILIFGVVTWIIPIGMATIGMLLAPMIVTILVLFGISWISYNFVESLLKTNISLISTAIIAGIIFFVFAYGNYVDLSLKARVIYLNNSMFTDIKGCDGFISPIRKNDCRNDYYRFYGYQQNTSDNDQVSKNFPSSQVKSIKIGAGAVANEYSIVRIKVTNISVNGKNSEITSQSHVLPDLYNVPNDQIDLRLQSGWYHEVEDAFMLGIVGMREGGIRDINFSAPKSWTIMEAGQTISIKRGDEIIFRIKLLNTMTP